MHGIANAVCRNPFIKTNKGGRLRRGASVSPIWPSSSISFYADICGRPALAIPRFASVVITMATKSFSSMPITELDTVWMLGQPLSLIRRFAAVLLIGVSGGFLISDTS
jgi:hypothetical protein